MAVEVVILVPLLLLVMLLVVAGGRFVSAQGDVQSLARDAARAASLERDVPSARAAAAGVVTQGSGSSSWLTGCEVSDFGGTFEPGGEVIIDVGCDAAMSDLGVLGFSRTVRIEGTSTAPLDQYRRTG